VGVRDFRDLRCWQLANELRNEVYAFALQTSASGDLGFCDDTRRASRSVAANIAEGFGRYTHREFAHFLSIARASLTETKNHLQHALDRRYLTDAEHRRLGDLTLHAQKAVSKLHSYLISDVGRGPRR
jgi:four helix bundle protein